MVLVNPFLVSAFAVELGSMSIFHMVLEPDPSIHVVFLNVGPRVTLRGLSHTLDDGMGCGPYMF